MLFSNIFITILIFSHSISIIFSNNHTFKLLNLINLHNPNPNYITPISLILFNNIINITLSSLLFKF